MVEIIGIRFKKSGKVYYFAPQGQKFNVNEFAVVETARGVEIGTVVLANRMVAEETIVAPLKPVMRKATEHDLKTDEENTQKEKEAFSVCEKKIKEHNLDMNLVDVEYTFDRSKVLFYFTADGRIDFRELVKSLASVFHVRIELRQIGVRDETKLIGGIGICGREVCCRKFLGDFQPVSIKMAKDQNLSLNPLKISGICGRLMCCLKYEQDTYEELLRYFPKVEAIVSTQDGKGTVMDSNVLLGEIKVRLDKDESNIWHTYKASDVVIIKDAEAKLTKEEVEKLKGLE